MSMAYDFVVATVISVISAVIHFIGVQLFSPGTQLFDIATDGTAVIGGTAKATLWFEILVVWVPVLVFGGVWAWAFVRMYRRQAATAVTRVR